MVKTLCSQCRRHRFDPWLGIQDPTCCTVRPKKRKENDWAPVYDPLEGECGITTGTELPWPLLLLPFHLFPRSSLASRSFTPEVQQPKVVCATLYPHFPCGIHCQLSTRMACLLAHPFSYLIPHVPSTVFWHNPPMLMYLEFLSQVLLLWKLKREQGVMYLSIRVLVPANGLFLNSYSFLVM